MLGVVIVWSAFQTRAERADEVQAEAGTIARTAVTLLNEYFASLDAMASTLVRHPAIRALDVEGATSTLREILVEQPLLGNISLRGPDGRLVTTAVPASTPAPSPSDVVTQVLRTGRPAASQLVIGPISGRRTVLLAYPVRADESAVSGVLTFSLDLPRLETVFARLPLPEGSVVEMADRRNLIIARSVDSEKFIGSAFQLARDSSPTSFQIDEDGVERFHGAATIARGPWLLSVAIPRTEVLKRLAPLWRRNLSIVAVAFAGVIALTLWISWQTAFDLRRLQSAAHQIASGDLSPPEQKPVHNREMEQLQSSFVSMADKLRSARDTLEQQFDHERKMREAVQTLQRQVVRQERLAAVGLLVSGVAHELNNPLQAILGTVELMERVPGVSSDVVELIAFIKAQSDRANDVIRSLALFGRHSSGAPVRVDLRDVIAEVLQLRKRDLDSKSITVDVQASSSGCVLANFAELEQVVLNFVVNAQQAIQDAGKPQGRIRITLVDADRGIRLEVADDGPGVLAENEPKLFQPFFTTKSVGYGTGLGLSVSYGIIDAYGGTIGYARNEWGGATFFVELPIDAGETQATSDGSTLLQRRVPPGV